MNSIAQKWFEENELLLNAAVKANHDRGFYTPYPEFSKTYGETFLQEGQDDFEALKHTHFQGIGESNETVTLDETSVFNGDKLKVSYPLFTHEQLIENAQKAGKDWKKLSLEQRFGVLLQALKHLQSDFALLGTATHHLCGQSTEMAFQASGPHALDRALEALAMAYKELTQFNTEVDWVKPVGKGQIKVRKSYKALPKGIGVLIGCATFPVWNSIGGLFANLAVGAPTIAKPHQEVTLPMAIVVKAIRKAISEAHLDPNILQLFVPQQPEGVMPLISSKYVKLIDFTGNPTFGNQLEVMPGKTVFTEKTGVNSILLQEVKDMNAVVQNIAFAMSLYSGQMCTAPQNIYVPKTGVKVGDQLISAQEVAEQLQKAIHGLVTHPKIGPGTVGALRGEAGKQKVLDWANAHQKSITDLEGVTVEPMIQLAHQGDAAYQEECFGPMAFVIEANSWQDAIEEMADLAFDKGAISCGAYALDKSVQNKIEDAMEMACVGVSFNYVGYHWLNQSAAFSDFHVSGGNPAGNASFTNSDFIARRMVWIGHRYDIN